MYGVRSFALAVENSPDGMSCHMVVVCSPREVKSATSGKAELALPTLAIAEVPVADLPVRDRLLLWENSQLVKGRVEHQAELKNKDKKMSRKEIKAMTKQRKAAIERGDDLSDDEDWDGYTYIGAKK